MEIKYFLRIDSFDDEFVLKTLLMLAGFKVQKVRDCASAELVYSPVAQDDAAKLIIIKNESPVLTHELVNGPGKAQLNNKILETDVISAAKAFMTDKFNICNTLNDYDIHSRLKFNSGTDAQRYSKKHPAVNNYIMFLRDWIETHIGIEPEAAFPDGKKCAIGLSHDVDRPLRKQFLREFRMPARWNLKQKSYHTLRYLNAIRHRSSYEDGYDCHIKKLMEEETKYSFKSTFFFCSSNMYSPYGTIYDVPYDINWQEVKECIKWVNEAGFETGLHASYNSYIDPARLKREKEILENIAGREVKGLRHHYWHLGSEPYKTLNFHAEAGFRYDSSFAFNEHIGFRLSFASGFYPLHPKGNSIITCMEIPALSMDGNFDYSRPNVAEEAGSAIEEHIAKLKIAGGTGILDWHTDTAIPVNKRNLGSAHAYLQILEILAADKEIWVTDLDEIYLHYEKKLGDLKHSTKSVRP